MKKLQYLIGIVLVLVLMPIRGMSQTTDDAHLAKKVWRGTKSDARLEVHETARVTRKAWRGTKRGARSAGRAPGRAIHHAKVKHQVHEQQEGETK